jgi:hypothetical protein
MAVSQFTLTHSASLSNATSYNTASITPTANRLVLVAVAHHTTTVTPPTTPTLSGNGLTWVQVATITYNTLATPHCRVTVFRAMGASPTSGTVTISFGSDGQNNCAWSIDEFDGVDTSGTNGSGAVVQSNTNNASSTSVSITLSAFGSTNNATYGAFGCGSNGITWSVGSGFSALDSHPSGVEDENLLTEWRTDNSTTVNASATGTSSIGGVGLEIKAAVAVVSIPNQIFQVRQAINRSNTY